MLSGLPSPKQIHNTEDQYINDFVVCSIKRRVTQVLGLPKNADYDAIQRAYRKKTAEHKGDDEAIQRIEVAHSSLMMSALTARMQGGVKVDKNVLYADRARFFPWRPRLYLAGKQLILYSGIAQAVLLAWALLSPMTAGTQPVVWCTCLHAFIFRMKINCLTFWTCISCGGEQSERIFCQGKRFHGI